MKLHEIYNYYQNNWSEACRELRLGFSTIYKWQKKGYIPIRSQMILERRTRGLFKARIEDATVEDSPMDKNARTDLRPDRDFLIYK